MAVKLERGQFVRITYNGRTVEAMVMVVSPNGKSLMFGFDCMLSTKSGAGYVGSMPVLQDEAGVYRDLVAGDEVTIEGRA